MTVKKWRELTEEQQQKALNKNIAKDIAPIQRVKRIAAFICLVIDNPNYFFDKEGTVFVGPAIEYCPPSKAYKHANV